jgi:hypothetical protein
MVQQSYRNTARRRPPHGISESRRKLLISAIVLGIIAPTALAAPGVKLNTNRNRQRELKYIFADSKSEDESPATQSTQSRDVLRFSIPFANGRSTTLTTPTPSLPRSTSQRNTSRLHEIKEAFQQAVVSEKKQNNVHVGKLLNAMSKMEDHMRQVGMKQQANELKGNYDKVMRLYSAAPPEKRDSLRELLRWELDAGVHGEIEKKDPIVKVKNQSGAMGLFWMGHTVKYQHDLYRLMMDEGMSPVEAATIAFQKNIEPHLPWAASRVGKAMIPRVTPSTQLEFFSLLGGYDGSSYGPEQHQGMTQDIKTMMNVWDKMLDEWQSPFAELKLSDI